MSRDNLLITAFTSTNALGPGQTATLAALRDQRGGLHQCDFDDAELNTWIGRVNEIEDVTLPDSLKRFDCRNNRLALLALEQDGFTTEVNRCSRQNGAARIGLFLGTSTSGIQATELAYRSRDSETGKLPAGFDLQYTHLIHSVVDFVGELLGVHGPSLTISTANSFAISSSSSSA